MTLYVPVVYECTKVLALLDCDGAPKVPVVLTNQVYVAPAAGLVTVIVLVRGEVQLLSGAPVKAADGGAVTVIPRLKVVSAWQPQLFVIRRLGLYTPFEA
jgi:hypothetical protein